MLGGHRAACTISAFGLALLVFALEILICILRARCIIRSGYRTSTGSYMYWPQLKNEFEQVYDQRVESAACRNDSKKGECAISGEIQVILPVQGHTCTGYNSK